jgi:hypothetical protein
MRCRDNLDFVANLAENRRNNLDDHADDIFLLAQKSVPGFSRYEIEYCIVLRELTIIFWNMLFKKN